MGNVTVIIPTLDEKTNLRRLLACLAAARPLVRNIIVSDGGSVDGTQTIAREAGTVLIEGTAGRGLQLRRGVAAANSGWLWLLHADTVLVAGWDEALLAVLADADPARAYYGRLRFASADFRARLLERAIGLRCRLFGLPYGDQSLLIHSALLEAVGSVPDLPLMEDVALARRLGHGRLALMDLNIETDASAYRRDGWLRRPVQNLWRLLRFLAGSNATKLAAGYRR